MLRCVNLCHFCTLSEVSMHEICGLLLEKRSHTSLRRLSREGSLERGYRGHYRARSGTKKSTQVERYQRIFLILTLKS